MSKHRLTPGWGIRREEVLLSVVNGASSVSDIRAKNPDMTADHVRMVLKRLVATGHIVRLHRGIYTAGEQNG